MVTLEDDANTLAEFGFTHNQAKIYAAITRLRTASVGSISKMAKVRREHVYRILPKLEKMGLINRMLGTPEKIKAIPVEDAFSVLIKKQKDEAEAKLSALAVEAKAFVEHFKQRDWGNGIEEDGSQFSLVSEKDAIMSQIAAAISTAHKDIAIIASRKKLARLMFFYAAWIKKSMKRGVSIRVITEMPEDEDVLPRIIEENVSPGALLELKYASALPAHYLIADGKEMVMGTSTEADFTECPSLWTNNASLISLTNQSFNNAWQNAMNWTGTGSALVSDKIVIMNPHRRK